LLYLYHIARAEYLEDREEKKAAKAGSKPTKASKSK
jgi:hypothetical protein